MSTINKYTYTYTPTDSSKPSAVPSEPQIDQPLSSPTPGAPSVTPGGFEIHLGPVTITEFDLSNTLHRQFLAGLISLIVAALVYRAYIRTRQHLLDKEAFEEMEATVGRIVDELKNRSDVPASIGYLDHLIYPKRVVAYKQLESDCARLREQLHDFENKYGGVISRDLEQAIHRLSVVSADKSPNIYAISVALDGVCLVAKRLGLPLQSTHPIYSIIFQLQQVKEAVINDTIPSRT